VIELNRATEISTFFLDSDRPRIACLCGSTRFRDHFEAETKRLTYAGEIVLSVGCFPHAEGLGDKEEGLGPDVALKLDRLHLRKIELADYILVINPGGYIGVSTAREIAFAASTGKRIEFLERVMDRESGERIHAAREARA
jgi:hypothetical protein